MLANNPYQIMQRRTTTVFPLEPWPFAHGLHGVLVTQARAHGELAGGAARNCCQMHRRYTGRLFAILITQHHFYCFVGVLVSSLYRPRRMWGRPCCGPQKPCVLRMALMLSPPLAAMWWSVLCASRRVVGTRACFPALSPLSGRSSLFCFVLFCRKCDVGK